MRRAAWGARAWLAVCAALAASAASAGLAACGGEPAPLPVDEPPAGCNPVGAPFDCLLPYPSDVFRDASGVRVPEVALPTAQIRGTEIPIDFLSEQPARGFSAASTLLALFPEPIDEEQLVFHTDDVSRSLDVSSPTLLVDAETGEPVAHFAELDPLAIGDETRALVMHPMARLVGGRRYVVIVHGLARADGALAAGPDAFVAMRDGRAPAWLGSVAARYETDMFPIIEALGIEPTSVQLAWDFTVREDADATAAMIRVRELSLEDFAAGPPVITVTDVIDAPAPGLARRVEGTMTVSLFVDSPEPGARLNLGEDGRVARNGTVEVPFSILVPDAVDSAPVGSPPARVVQYGHGFFGSREEALSDWAIAFMNETSTVFAVVDWWGMARDDMLVVANDVLTEPSKTLRFTERVHQAMANQMALARALRTTIAELDELQRGGAPIYDPSTVYFWGNSQGHILGGTYLGIAPDVERGVLGVGGAGLSLMIFRAGPFLTFYALLRGEGVGDLEVQKFAALAQTSFDSIDPATYAPWVLEPSGGGLLVGAPAERRVLMHLGLGDPAVPNVAGRFHARSMGLPLLAPATREVFGLGTVPAPHDGSAVVEFDFGVSEPLPGTYANVMVYMNDVHESVRQLGAVHRQMDSFLRPGGLVEATCNGVCDPE